MSAEREIAMHHEAGHALSRWRSAQRAHVVDQAAMRQRFLADRGDPMRVRDVLIGEARADARPCRRELPLGAIEVGGVAPVVANLRPAGQVTAPQPGPPHAGRRSPS